MFSTTLELAKRQQPTACTVTVITTGMKQLGKGHIKSMGIIGSSVLCSLVTNPKQNLNPSTVFAQQSQVKPCNRETDRQTDWQTHICHSHLWHPVLPKPDRPRGWHSVSISTASARQELTKLMYCMVCLFTSQQKLVLIYQPQGDGRLSWPSSLLPGWFSFTQMVTHLITNRAHCWLTSLITPTS